MRERLELRRERLAPSSFHAGIHVRDEIALSLREEVVQELLPIAEVVVDRADGDARAPRDGGQARTLDAVLDDGALGRLEERITHRGAQFFTQFEGCYHLMNLDSLSI